MALMQTTTSEVGLIKIIKTARISDGIVRLYYVAGEHALQLLNEESAVINHLTNDWGIGQDDLLPTASRFFEGYKKYSAQLSKQATTILDLTIKLLLFDPHHSTTGSAHSRGHSHTVHRQHAAVRRENEEGGQGSGVRGRGVRVRTAGRRSGHGSQHYRLAAESTGRHGARAEGGEGQGERQGGEDQAPARQRPRREDKRRRQ